MNTEEKEYRIVDGFKMLDEEKDRDGNILQAIVNEVFQADIMSRSRIRDNSDAKRVYGVILKERGYTYTKIGRFLRKDHSTIIHYNRDFDFIVNSDNLLKEKYLLCKKRFLEDLERADAINAEAYDKTLQSTIYRLNKTIKKLEQQVEYLDMKNESLTNQNEWYEKEISKYNAKYDKLYKIITDRTKPGTVTELARKLNTFYNGVYSEVIEVY